MYVPSSQQLMSHGVPAGGTREASGWIHEIVCSIQTACILQATGHLPLAPLCPPALSLLRKHIYVSAARRLLWYAASPLSYGYRLGAAGPDAELERPLEKSHAGACWGEFLRARTKGAEVSTFAALEGRGDLFVWYWLVI